MNFKDLPAPSEYSDWQSWAASLVSSLSTSGEGNNNYPLFVYDDSKARKGLPVAADGDMIRVLQDGEIKFKVWRDKTQKWEDLVKADVTQADLQELKSEMNASLAEKANLSLSNLNRTGKVYIGHCSKPTLVSYVDYTPPSGASSITVTAPDDGFLAVKGSTSNNTSYYLSNANFGVAQMGCSAYGYFRGGAFFPIAKGQTATVTKEANATISNVRFYRTVGYNA